MLTKAIIEFVQDHLNDDPARLLLAAHRYPGVPVRQAVAQIRALQKVRTKIPVWYRFDLAFPPLLSVEQASSEQTARFKAGLFSGHRMADLTGGMGVDAYFFAQHFEQVTYVERRHELVEHARYNFGILGAGNIKVLNAETEDFLNEHPDTYDLIYLDPARRDEQQRRVFRLADCQPNVPEILDLLFARAPLVLLKTAPLLDLQSVVEQLNVVTKIWVVAVENEVKEVLYLLAADAGRQDYSEIPITAVNMGNEQPRTFVFTRAEEQTAVPEYSVPLRYLYEPDAAILKAGAFKSFARRFGLFKLHPNTHLYTSADFIPDVPGRAFTVETVVRYDRKAVGAVVPGGKANIAARNFPDSAEAMRKKLGLGDGGEVYLFGVTDLDGKKVVVGRKV